jgi:DNA-binding beta-propeller fold protein YncE
MTFRNAVLLCGLTASTLSAASFRVVARYPVPGDGSWDYLAVDSGERRLYVSHGTQVDVLNADTGESVGKIPDTKGVHGIALAPVAGRGFTSNGQSDNATVFDMRTLETLGHVKTGKKPDFILFEPATGRIFTFNGESLDATVIDGATYELVGRVELGGAPEAAAADATGLLYVNLEDKNAVAMVDARTLQLTTTWPLAPCEAPASMGIDRKNFRLFIGCRNKMLAVVDAKTGHVITTLPVGDHVDATAFDSQTGNIFSSNGDGTLTVIHQDSADKYSVVQNVKTEPGAKTLVLDPITHKVFLSVAKRENGKVVPGTFTVLVVSNQ